MCWRSAPAITPRSSPPSPAHPSSPSALDGYLGAESGAPYDRIIVTCGVAGLSPHWLDQLAPAGLVVAPIAHGGMHPILAASSNDLGEVSARAALWADFMPATGPLHPDGLVGHDPTDCVPPTTPVTRIPEASRARTTAAYHDLWFFLATRDSRITRTPVQDDDGTVGPTTGACTLRVPARGTAWVQTDGSITAVGEPALAAELLALIHTWEALNRPALTQHTCTFEQANTPGAPLWTPHHWTHTTTCAD